jgi:hypothetical protein
VQVALQDFAEGTGLSKRSVQSAVGWLAKRKLVTIARDSLTAVPVYTSCARGNADSLTASCG